jgi:asparagine synthase (glutamine-hydrolysing)
MCGIAGLFDSKGSRPYDRETFARMVHVIAHRGPDGSGLHQEPGLALGHRRLAIIDLAGGAQPMHSADGTLTVVFNGEVYNFRELRLELEARGARFVTRSDTEVLLHGWREWGEQMLARLNGMFAFALWDARTQTCVLARDRCGKKPLQYALLDDGTLAFGSEIKSLLCLSEVSRELDSCAVADFFTYGYVPDPKTIYAAIRKLPPAHVLIARRGHAPRIAAYWSLLDTIGYSEARPDELMDRLSAAVARRLISDVPLGALLSGGVDSSAVVSLMADAEGGRPRTF